MRFDVITLFPELVDAVAQSGIIKRAVRRQIIDIHCWNPRDYTHDVHRTVDDRPYGGGPGMVMKADCLLQTITAIKAYHSNNLTKVIYLSPQGQLFTQQIAKNIAAKKTQTQYKHDVNHLILLCGRYEGIDERVIDLAVDEEWSIGDYVLTGGELGAMVIIDAITRLLPQTLGHAESAQQDSFMTGLLDHPHYTRPEKMTGANLPIPTVLKSGHHANIKQWRRKQALGRTYTRRPDLLQKQSLSDEDKQLLNHYLKEQTT